MVNSSYKIGETIYNLTETIINNYKLLVKKKIDFKYNEYYKKMELTYFLQFRFFAIDFLTNYTFENGLLYVLNSTNNCKHTQCIEYNFNIEEKTELYNLINIKMNNITNIISSFFDDNFKFNFVCSLNFANSGINAIKPICESFKKFLSFENQEQSTLINEYIQDYIKSNLDDFLNNVVPNFGNPFFERLIDYNINFKIVDLYQNLRYSLARTMLYYYVLNEFWEGCDLPYDLKDRLYRLNDLNLIVQEKQEVIKKLLEKKLSELIDDLKDTAKETYTYYLKENNIIKSSFSPLVLEKIDYNLGEIMEDLDNKYQVALEKYLKEKFTTSFSEILDEKTKDMIKVFYNEKNILIEKIDDLFSLEENKELNEVNRKINQTLESIQNYNHFVNTFEISNDVVNFFNDYGKTTLLPLFQKFDKDLYNKIKLLIMSSINEKSYIIENLKTTNFYHKTSDIENYLLTNYINIIINETYIYGVSKVPYESNLNYTKNKIFKRLTESRDENDSEEEKRIIMESTDVKESLNQLYNIAYNN